MLLIFGASRQLLKFNENILGFVTRKLLDSSDLVAKLLQGPKRTGAHIDQYREKGETKPVFFLTELLRQGASRWLIP